MLTMNGATRCTADCRMIRHWPHIAARD
jgi:hypothetical protein